MYEPLVLIVMDFATLRVTHCAGYPGLPPLDCTMFAPRSSSGTMERLQQEAKQPQKVHVYPVSRRAGMPVLFPSRYILWGVPHQPKLALGNQSKDCYRHH